MYPVTFGFLPTYGLLFAGAVLVGWWWFVRRGRSLGLPDDQLFNLAFYTLIAGIVGAKLTLVLLDWDFYLNDPSRLLGVIRSAGVVIGGIIAGSAAFVWYSLRQGLPLHRLGDAVAAPLALSQALGRGGCFAAGCCWGKRAHEGNPFAVVFTDPRAITPELGIPLVPTQLMHLGSNLLLALLLTWLWRRRLEPAGTTFWVYVLLYSISRGTIEFWRGDTNRGVFFGDGLATGVSTSQLFSIFGVLLAVFMLVHDRVQMRRPAQTKSG